MTMFDGLTMVSYDGHNRNKMMVDHGRPWSGGQMFAGATCFCCSCDSFAVRVTIT